MSSVAAALSEHPVTAHAVGEVAGSLLEDIGERPDLVLVFVTQAHAGALEDVLGTLDAVLHPLVLSGAASEAVIGPHREVEGGAGVAALALRCGPLLPLALDARGDPTLGIDVRGWTEEAGFEPSALVLLGDPYSFPATGFLAWAATRYPGLPVVGGLAAGALGPGGTRLALGTSVRTSGAVAVLLGPGLEVEPVVSQGSRPFGQPLVVTRSEANIIFELAGRPALQRLVDQAKRSLDATEVETLEQGGLQLGTVIDEHRPEFGPGDFLMHGVLGADRRNGAIAVGSEVPVGTTVQFHLRDAHAADAELRAMLTGRDADGALLFTCNGRGTQLFGQPHHDARVLAELLGPLPLAGCFVAGELGPIAGRNFLHGFTAAMALLRERRSDVAV